MDARPATPSDNPSASTFNIAAVNLGKRFNRDWIFRNLDYDFLFPQRYVITGPNGSGKSTLLQLLWGQLPPTTGEVRFSTGLPVHADDITRYIAIAAPYMDLIGELTLMEHLRFHFSLRTMRDGLGLQELLDVAYLNDAADKYIRNFSSGMKQRLKLALALYTQADVVFLDEPGTNLDQRAFEWYKQEMEKVKGKCMVIMASNNPAEQPPGAEVIDIMKYKAKG